MDLNYVLQLPKEHLALQSGKNMFAAPFVWFLQDLYEPDCPLPQQMTSSPCPDRILPFSERSGNPPVFGCCVTDETLGIVTSLPSRGKKNKQTQK